MTHMSCNFGNSISCIPASFSYYSSLQNILFIPIQSIVLSSVHMSLNDIYLHHILHFKEHHSLALNNDIVLTFSESSISVCTLKKGHLICS